MGNYNLSTRAQFDLAGIYKNGIKYFGKSQAAHYLYELESFLKELADRPELAQDASFLSNSLKFCNFKAPIIFDNEGEIYVVRVPGKRMNFIEHL